MSDVVTGEAVALELRRASVPSRLLAGGLDLLIQLAAFLAVLILISLIGSGSGDGNVQAIVGVVLTVLIVFAYPIVCETLLRGRTVGKMALGLRVVRVDGGPITFRQALVRGLFAGLLEKPGILFGFSAWIGILTMLVNTDSRRLGDLAAGTMVIRDRVPTARTRDDPVVMPLALAGWAELLDLGRLDDRLALSVRQYLSRLNELAPAPAEHLGRSLATAVAAVTTPPAPPGTPAWAYLSAVLAERRRRSLPPAAVAATQPIPAAVVGWDSRAADTPPPAPSAGPFAPPR